MKNYPPACLLAETAIERDYGELQQLLLEKWNSSYPGTHIKMSAVSLTEDWPCIFLLFLKCVCVCVYTGICMHTHIYICLVLYLNIILNELYH